MSAAKPAAWAERNASLAPGEGIPGDEIRVARRMVLDPVRPVPLHGGRTVAFPGLMNIHFLELFYYVAHHGGITPAVRHMPYGIQQPAVSAQILQLEESLGTSLFVRRPFALTQAGVELYDFIRPFFENLGSVAARIRGGATRLLRVAASSSVLRDHLPELLAGLRARFPGLQLALKAGLQPQSEALLLRQEVDVAVTVLQGRPASGVRTQELIGLPLVLLVPAASGIRSAEGLLGRDRIAERLISLPAYEGPARVFQEELARRKVVWPVGIEVEALDLVEAYAAAGFGIGLAVGIPGHRFPKAVRVLKLDGFDRIVVGAMWMGKPAPIVAAFLEALKGRARDLLTS